MKHKISEFLGRDLLALEAAEMLADLIGQPVDLQLFCQIAERASLPAYIWPAEEAFNYQGAVQASQGFEAFSEGYQPMSVCGRYALAKNDGYAYALKALTETTREGAPVAFGEHDLIRVYGGWLVEGPGAQSCLSIEKEHEYSWEFEAIDGDGQAFRWQPDYEVLQYMPRLTARFMPKDIKALARKIDGVADEKPEPRQSKGDQEPRPRNQINRQALQEFHILETMERLGMNPLAYPYPGSGRKGAMSIIINELLPEGRKQVRRVVLDGVRINLSYSIITKAWERLRGSGKIRSEKEISEPAAPACKSGADAGT